MRTKLLAQDLFGFTPISGLCRFTGGIIRYGRSGAWCFADSESERANATIAGTLVSAAGCWVSFHSRSLFLVCEPDLASRTGDLLAACLSSLDLQPVTQLEEMDGRSFTRSIGAVHGNRVIHILWFPIAWLIRLHPCCRSCRCCSVSRGAAVTGFVLRAPLSEADGCVAGFPLALAMLAAVLFGPTVRVFLKHYCSAAEVGVYAAAWQLVMIAKFGLGQIGRIGNPAMARLACADVPILERRRTIGKYALVMLVAASPIALPSIFCPDLIITTLFSSEYAAAVDVLRILGVYILLLSWDRGFAMRDFDAARSALFGERDDRRGGRDRELPRAASALWSGRRRMGPVDISRVEHGSVRVVDARPAVPGRPWQGSGARMSIRDGRFRYRCGNPAMAVSCVQRKRARMRCVREMPAGGMHRAAAGQ